MTRRAAHIPEGAEAPAPKKRIRPSGSALKLALQALKDVGIPVEKVLVTGGQYEIISTAIAQEDETENHGDLEGW